MITFENAKRCHYRMWDWLAKTGEDDKSLWPEFSEKNKHGKFIQEPMNVCFACEIVTDQRMHFYIDCKRCPIIWNDNKWGDLFCCKKDSPFRKWEKSRTTETRKKWAAIIRDLPWVRR